MQEKDWEGVEWLGKADFLSVSVGEAYQAIFWPTPDWKEGTFNTFRVSAAAGLKKDCVLLVYLRGV